MWDADYTDVDLHVLEPGGEEVFYQHPHSAAGGRPTTSEAVSGRKRTSAHMAKGPYQIVIEDYAPDTTQVSAETLVHIIFYVRGERQDRFVTLTAGKDRRTVALVER